ncbi:MAG: TIGR01212 family radical SAM protein [Nitrospiraceae bacterium]|nr:TIGR01212 family radical SAM protein [Nitrospiraceae bacterium]
MTVRYNAFGPYLKKMFGSVVYKVNVDAGFTCPNRDGTLGVDGCIYCNNKSFRPSQCDATLSVKQQIINGISYLGPRYGAKKFLAYFQPYTNTYAPVDELERLYKEALSAPGVIGLAIGTRPDCVDEDKIRLLQQLAKDYFILVEYGVQSIHDKSLEYINRGHDYKAFLDALDITKGRGIHTGAHIIVGFPTETQEETLLMADALSDLPVEFLKIHQLQVIKDTLLGDEYIKKPFCTFEYGEYIDFLIDFIQRLSPDIVLQRLFATAPDDILLAPRWDRNKHQIIVDIEKRMKERDAFQGAKRVCHRS